MKLSSLITSNFGFYMTTVVLTPHTSMIITVPDRRDALTQLKSESLALTEAAQ